MREYPSERPGGAVTLLAQAVEPAVDAPVVQVQIGIGPERHPRAGGMRLAAAVFPGQPAARERTERLVAEPVLGAQRQYVRLVPSLEQRVRVLDELRPSVLERLFDLGRGEVAEPVGADGALVDELVERAERLCERRLRVELVRQIEVDPVDAEPLEARRELAQDPVAREAAVVARVHGVVRLRREPRPVPGCLDPPPMARSLRPPPYASA